MIALAAAGLYKSVKKNKNTENFTNDSNNAAAAAGAFSGVLLGLYIFFVIVFAIVALVIWARTVYIAFKCSMGDGICALLFFSLWSMWKFGTLVDSYCTKSSTIM